MVVLPEQVISGVASGHGPAGCAARATPVYITGRQIRTATFYVDGHKVKTVAHPNKAGRWGITVSAKTLRYGAHRVKVIVVFTASSQTNAADREHPARTLPPAARGVHRLTCGLPSGSRHALGPRRDHLVDAEVIG